MGGKELVPTRDAVAKLITARLAPDVCGVPTVLVARTDAEAADLVTSDIDDNDKPHLTGERTVEGFFRSKPGLEQAISRGLAYAPYADLVWCETGKPDLEYARKFAEAIHKQFPGKLLAYNCSPSFHWKKNLDDGTIAKFKRELQQAEFAAADRGFTAVKHQREVGTGYFDAVTTAIEGAESSTTALKGSTETEQF